MSDKYQSFVNGGVGRRLSSSLGLPRPAILRRYRPEAPVLPGFALVVTLGSSRVSRPLTRALTAADVEVMGFDDPDQPYAAIIIDASGVDRIEQLERLPEQVSGALKRLRPSGRVIVFGTAPTPDDDPETAAARQALDGLTRSLAKEVRAGSTANLIRTGADPKSLAVESTLRFFLSGRSAYIDGQVVELDDADPAGINPDGVNPDGVDWTNPLRGKVALVTGAARGIGRAIATTLARDGAHVICADLPSAGEALARVANAIGGTTLQLDISSDGTPQQVADHLRGRFGGVDIVVHNAGITRDKLLANMKPEVWSSVLDVNLGAQLRINAELVEQKLLRANGRIVCLSSTSGIAGNRGQTNYAASKAGIIGMVRATAGPLAADGSTINAVAPGFIDTEMTARMPFATREIARRLNSLQQAGLPVDVAEAVAWLASPGAGAVSGQVLRVCGQNLVGA